MIIKQKSIVNETQKKKHIKKATGSFFNYQLFFIEQENQIFPYITKKSDFQKNKESFTYIARQLFLQYITN